MDSASGVIQISLVADISSGGDVVVVIEIGMVIAVAIAGVAIVI
jgi:hypothetical protein